MKVVLLHALPLDPRMWEPQAEALAGYEVVRPTLYELGGNTMEQWAEAVLAQAGPGPLVLVGSSMGGYLALAIAAHSPERIAGVALIGSRADAEAEERKPLRAELIATIRESGAEGMWRAMRPRLFPREAPAEVLRDARDIALSQKPDGLVAAVEAIRDRPDGTGVLASLDCPVLLVCGTDDPLATVDEQRAWAGSAREGRLVVLEGAGHLPSLERPEEFNPVLAEWLAAHWPREHSASVAASAAMPKVVDAAWLAAHLGEEDLIVGDVRGPNAHTRHGHIPGSIPLVLGSPPPSSEPEVLQELAVEVARRLGRHGVTPDKRLVVYDGGDCVGATASVQMAELAGHANVAILAGGIGAWEGTLEHGEVELDKVIRPPYEPNLGAIATRDELRARLSDPELVLIDVRSADEFRGRSGAQCDPRQGHIPGARNLEHTRLFAAPGRPHPRELIRSLTGLPDNAEIVCYCHSGSRSGLAMMALRAAGYDARNYPGSWHEWSRHSELPAEKG